MSETADERTDVSGRTWCATYTSLRLLFYTETIGTLYYRSNKRVSTLGTITECRQKECPEETIRLLKHNKYVCILSIAVVTLLYITISMIAIFSMYIAHVCLGSGHNSYQGHVNDSGEFWRVLGCTHIRCH